MSLEKRVAEPEQGLEGGTDCKKLKYEGESAVVHARNLPVDCTEDELNTLGQSFGKIVNILILKGKSQAFIELDSPAAASQLLSFYSQSPPHIRTRPIYFQFSSHQHIQKSNSEPLSAETSEGGIGRVLHVTIENLFYPVTLDTLYHIFVKFGAIARIVTFSKNVFQALIEFTDFTSANAAKVLNGQNIYAHCCTLKIQPSKLEKLNVKFNNDKSRDFSQQVLPADPSVGMLPTMPGLIGFPAFSPFPYGPSAAFAYPLAYPARPPFSLGGASFDFATQHMPGALSSFPRDGCVILVNNLDETKVTPDVLFTLFGVYADVAKVKILFNKKESALVEVMDPQQASIAVSHLEGVPLYGRPLQLMLSRHKSVQLPKDSGGPVEGRILNKDFSDSNLHRFRKPGSRNFRNIVAPSATLHLSNIPDDVSEDRIKEIFMKQKMPEILSFRFLNPKEPKEGRKMALAQFGSIEDAVYSLIFMHDYKIDDKLNLRVSFSKLDC